MEQQPRLPLWFLVANWALIAGAFYMGVRLGERSEPPTKLVAALPQAQLEALAVVHREILQSHVDPHDGKELLEEAIKGMVASLDPYSRYVPPAEVASYEEDNTGHYEGIGADFGTHGDRVVLHFPLAGGPAELAGLQPGDQLLAVDGTGLDSPEARARVAELVRGQSGSEVRLRLQRGDNAFDVVLKRSDVQRPCVKWSHRIPGDDGLGYVHLTDFHPGACHQLLAAIDALQQPGPLRGLVLDLRWNGGGSLDECIAIARTFLPTGLIVSQTRRDSEVVERHEAKAELCRHPNLPLVLLVNERSASASEVLAGALQDHHRAVVVGQRTHGKAYVNTVYTWKGLPFRLKLTTGKYRTPNGRNIERRYHAQNPTDADAGGIAPDVPVPLTQKQQEAVFDVLRASEPPAAHREAFAALAARLEMRVPAPPQAATDPQLERAVAALRDRIAHPDAGGADGAGKDK